MSIDRPDTPRTGAAILSAGILLLLFAVYYGLLLPVGTINHHDEFHTLDRSHSFLVRDDPWSVFSENRPTFIKPPLQYWLTAALLDRGLDLELALRLPSYVFGLLLIATVGWLTAILLPSCPWAIPASMAIFSGSTRFWEAALSALLDTGAMLFAAVAVTATLAALKQPKWWYAVAVACGLGALQKAPIAVAFVMVVMLGVALTRRYHGVDARRAVMNVHFAAAATLTVLAVCFWPALQWLRYGSVSFQDAYVRQMAHRFSPFGVADPKTPSLYWLMTDGEAPLRLLGMAALIWLPFRLRRAELIALALPLLLYVIVVVFAKGWVAPRYSLLFLPFLAAASAIAVFEIFRGRAAVIFSVVALSLVWFWPFKRLETLGADNSRSARFVPLAVEVGAALKHEETLVVCDWDRDRIAPGLLSFYASAQRPFFRLRSPNAFEAALAKGALGPRLRGLCTEEQLHAVGGLLTGLKRLTVGAGYVHWTATGQQL